MTAAKCGISAMNRPCMLASREDDIGLPYPRNPICQTPGEKIYVVDDDPAFLEEVTELLGWIGTPVVSFDNPFDFQKGVTHPIAGCVILDIRMPAYDGVSLHRWLREVDCIAPVIFLSGSSNISTAVDCMKSGALDFLVKPVKETDLNAAVIAAISTSRKRFCEQSSTQYIRSLLDKLTPAERKVADCIAKGYLTKQIASMLDRSENTIKIHRYRILNKVGVTSSAGLVRLMSSVQNESAG